MRAIIFLICCLFAATAAAQCVNGVCERPVRPVQAVKKTVTKVVQKATVRETRRVHVLRLFRRGR